MNIGVLGAGTWGMALSALLSKNGHNVTVWSALPHEIDYLTETKTHPNLPGTVFSDEIHYTKSIEEACRDKELMLFVVASQFIRSTTALAAPYLSNGVILVNASKGIESSTLKTMTEVMADELFLVRDDLNYKLVALSGPTHAEEVAMGMPTSIVSACEDEEVSLLVAKVFLNSCMRVYTNTDVMGVELCGALKNIISLAAGINRGMGLGDNTKAMLMTRGISEMTRIGLAMGCRRRTFMGLAGIGDLIVTCTSVHSRNNRCGELIGKGMTYNEAAAEIGMVVEGYHALEAAVALSKKYDVEMPITAAVYDIIKNGKAPKDAMYDLMTRDIKNELDT
ncbi:MAG: NAD(P)-dependent glycerol-3-phosphate dehydrogenase [Clostridia bacterium]|nr:NAD(P)-dependent glycerol-3-phosphate dehydrogenase [Clostridia bacterium]